MTTIVIASDHAGFELKEHIKSTLSNDGYHFQDYGTFSAESMDYPDVIHPLSAYVNNNENQLGIIICGSGNGVSIVANKYPHVRAALCWQPELAALARQHNNANIIALPARFIQKDLAITTVRLFLNTSFEGGRHSQRVEKISKF